jgi:hypothetical protein
MNGEKQASEFSEYRVLILSELQRLSSKIDLLDGKVSNLHTGEINNLKIELGSIKTKMVIISFLGATVASAIVAAVFSYFSR